VILSLEAPKKSGKSIPEFGETHSSVLGLWKETIFSTDYEQVLFCIVFPFSFFIFKSLSQ
jgi:hypothetical protein